MTKIKFLFILFLFYSIQLYSQSEYIIDKKGNKIIIDEGSSQMSAGQNEKLTKITTTIFYTINGKNDKIELLDIQEASYGNYKIDTFKFDLKHLDKELPFFTLIEHNGFRLISLRKSDINCFSFIVDSNGKIIEDLSFNVDKYKGEDLENRARIDSKIREYFGNCEELIKRLDRYKYNTVNSKSKSKSVKMMKKDNSSSDNKNFENLNSFFYNPIYLTCK